MATPVLIDADMGADDAAAVVLAMASGAVDLHAVVGVGGTVRVDQAVINIGRLLKAVGVSRRPIVGRGLDQADAELKDRRDLFGEDGFGGCSLPADDGLAVGDFRDVYRQAVAQAGGELVVVAVGPLSNLAALLQESPDLFRALRQIVIAGGAVWTAGDVHETTEFTFYRDAPAAHRILSSGLPVSVVSLDVVKMVCLDESHLARLAASGCRTGEVLARLLRYPAETEIEPGYGKVYVAGALAVGSLVWPDLFLGTRMRLDVETTGPKAGRCKPALGGDKVLHVNLLTAVNAVDFVENLLESVCHEAFFV